MKQSSVFITIGMVGVMGLLIGCDKVKEGMGMERQVPDAFAVVALPPLSLPPEFNLQPPSPSSGEEAEEVIGALDAQVEEQNMEVAVFGQTPMQSKSLDKGEQAFLALVQENSIPVSVQVPNVQEALKAEANLSSTPKSLKEFIAQLKKSFKKDTSVLDANKAYQETQGETVGAASVRGILVEKKEGESL